MAHRHAFEALDRTMRDILSNDDPTAACKPFGGKTVLLGGDFRQILPVIPQGTRQETVAAAINRSHLWDSCVKFKLSKNMRVDPEEKEFAKWILKVGDGEAPKKNKKKKGIKKRTKSKLKIRSCCQKMKIQWNCYVDLFILTYRSRAQNERH